MIIMRDKRQEFDVGIECGITITVITKENRPNGRIIPGSTSIVRLIQLSNYVLQKSPIAVPFVVHANNIKRYYNPLVPN